jgi:2'-5' RNA ligase
MYYALVHFPNIDTTHIDHIRSQYDPTAHLIAPHITVLFPVPDEVGENALVKHIEGVIKPWKPFPIRINGFHKSWDHWLFLTLEDGKAEVVRLHTEIYTGIIQPYRRKDIDFVPHISLGLFVKEGVNYDLKKPQELDFDERKYKAALQESGELGLDYHCVLDRLHLVMLMNDFSSIEVSREFLLGGGMAKLR